MKANRRWQILIIGDFMKKLLLPKNILILLLVLFTIVIFTFPEAYKYNRIFIFLFLLNIIWSIYYEKKKELTLPFINLSLRHTRQPFN